MLPVLPDNLSLENYDKSTPIINDEKVKILEKDTVLTPGEKINLILMLKGYKWISEIGMNYEDLAVYSDVLEKLELPFQTDSNDYDRWITVGANESTLHYVNKRKKVLSEIEAGILYGYPVTHTLGFTGILEAKNSSRRKVQDFFLGGVYSKVYIEEEHAYFDKLWKVVEVTSPEIVRQSIEYFEKI